MRALCGGRTLIFRNTHRTLIFWNTQDGHLDQKRIVRISLTLEILVKPSHSHRIISAQTLYGGRTSSVRFLCGICVDCTATAPALHDFRTISTQPRHGFVGPVARCPNKKSHDARTQCERIRHSP